MYFAHYNRILTQCSKLINLIPSPTSLKTGLMLYFLGSLSLDTHMHHTDIRAYLQNACRIWTAFLIPEARHTYYIKVRRQLGEYLPRDSIRYIRWTRAKTVLFRKTTESFHLFMNHRSCLLCYLYYGFCFFSAIRQLVYKLSHAASFFILLYLIQLVISLKSIQFYVFSLEGMYIPLGGMQDYQF